VAHVIGPCRFRIWPLLLRKTLFQSCCVKEEAKSSILVVIMPVPSYLKGVAERFTLRKLGEFIKKPLAFLTEQEINLT
jgi:hypothetical protein